MVTTNRIVLIAIFVGCATSLAAQTFLSPGIKLAYRFGDNGGFIGGLDVSVIRASNHGYYGLVVAVDQIHSAVNAHLGIEGGFGPVGLCVGPVLTLKDRTLDYGLRITPYAGVLLVPFYNYQLMHMMSNEHEVGAYIKIPVLFSGETLFGRIGG
jgi:hypothetical protein